MKNRLRITGGFVFDARRIRREEMDSQYSHARRRQTGGAVRGIERGVLLKTARQIGIGQEKRTIGDQADNAFLQLGFATFTGISRACHKCM